MARKKQDVHEVVAPVEKAGALTRTRKSALTCERIMVAAAELMREHGGTGFQMGEVSERCGMSKGSLYYYFADKGELVRAVFDRAMDELVADVEASVARASSARASILALVRTVARAVRPGSTLTLALAHGIWDVEREVLPRIKEDFDHIISVLEAQIERAKGEGWCVRRPTATWCRSPSSVRSRSSSTQERASTTATTPRRSRMRSSR